MVDAIIYGYTLHQARLDPLQAPKIVAVLIRRRAAPMMRVDTAAGTEVVLRSPGVEAIDSKEILTLNNAQIIKGNCAHDGALSAAHRASAASCVNNSVWKIQLQDHATAMAACPVLALNDGSANLTNGMQSHDDRLLNQNAGNAVKFWQMARNNVLLLPERPCFIWCTGRQISSNHSARHPGL